MFTTETHLDCIFDQATRAHTCRYYEDARVSCSTYYRYQYRPSRPPPCFLGIMQCEHLEFSTLQSYTDCTVLLVHLELSSTTRLLARFHPEAPPRIYRALYLLYSSRKHQIAAIILLSLNFLRHRRPTYSSYFSLWPTKVRYSP